MQWLNEPQEWQETDTGMTATSDQETDFWRKTHDNGLRDNGHYRFAAVDGDFSARVKITGLYVSQYDQAGLMVRVDDATWLKCGIEFVDGRQNASAVVTRDYSDWSIVPLDNPPAIWMKCERHDVTFTISYSLNGSDFDMIRQSFLTERSSVQLGLVLASPKGAGFSVQFDDYSVVTGQHPN